jgi:formylglycine-generating enzyme required for sulfatase activity
MTSHPLALGHAPAWAVAWGQDGFGVFADAVFAGVVQRMRWIPPGTFWMGSPEGEAGRFDNEVRHRVTLTSGYWLGDTPVTRALWWAVMGDNPSRFEDPTRPVANVGWSDCQRFFERLPAGAGGAWRLPTEAEWERACRAGTDTATWRGDLDVLGANRAPLLDPIAWYGGNSGVVHEIDYAESTDGPVEVRRTQLRDGTHEVATRAPNPWGLYDTLGNVWEWCADGYRSYTRSDVVDPYVRSDGRTAAGRVFRGGSWTSPARGCRAACRHRRGPSDRWIDLGFRLARGPVLDTGGAGGAGEGAAKVAERP